MAFFFILLSRGVRSGKYFTRANPMNVSKDIRRNVFCCGNYFPRKSAGLPQIDSFLWGYVKEKVPATAPTTKNDMKRGIHVACKFITTAMLSNVRETITGRINMCLEANFFNI